jgi:hypothetical protein
MLVESLISQGGKTGAGIFSEMTDLIFWLVSYFWAKRGRFAGPTSAGREQRRPAVRADWVDQDRHARARPQPS